MLEKFVNVYIDRCMIHLRACMTGFISRFQVWCKIVYRTMILSVSSADFYSDVHRRYSGYGVRYLFSLYLISGIILCTCVFVRLLGAEEELSSANPDVEYILRQIPEVYYDGIRITTKAETPFFLYSKNDQKIVAIDPGNELVDVPSKDLLPIFRSTYVKLPIA